jgi:hypothetical protein
VQGLQEGKNMTPTHRTTVVGVFTEQAAAERAIEALYRAGFSDNQIGFVTRDTRSQDMPTATETESDKGTMTAAGAVSGGVIGGILGAAAALLIPGVGPAIAGGILTATIAGAAVGAVAGGLVGALTSMGVPEEEAQYYQQELAGGRTIVTVNAAERSSDALNILRSLGAYDVTTAPTSADSTAPEYGTPMYNTPTYAADDAIPMPPSSTYPTGEETPQNYGPRSDTEVPPNSNQRSDYVAPEEQVKPTYTPSGPAQSAPSEQVPPTYTPIEPSSNLPRKEQYAPENQTTQPSPKRPDDELKDNG